MASYILYGKDENGLNAVQRGELTNSNTRYNSFRVQDDKNVSYESLVESSDPDNAKLLDTKIKRDVYMKKRTTIKYPRINKKTGEILDPGDSDIPGMVELWESIEGISRLIKVLEGTLPPSEDDDVFSSSYRLYKLKHQKIELCREQYYLKDLYKPTIHWLNVDRPGPQYVDWTSDSYYWMTQEEWQTKVQNSYSSAISKRLEDYETRQTANGTTEVKWVVRRHIFDWQDPAHVRALMNNWQPLYDMMHDHPNTYGNTLLLDFERYRELAQLSPSRECLLECKLRQLDYEASARVLEEKCGIHYAVSNITLIITRELPRRIAQAAQRLALELDTPEEEKKKCYKCKRMLPRSPLFFAYNANRRDGFSSNCKVCEKRMRDERKEDNAKWKKIVLAQKAELASAASKPNP